MPRPAVDIVIPFAGDEEALRRLIERCGCLRRAPGDTVVVVDNTPRERPAAVAADDVEVVGAAQVPSSYFARNRGAQRHAGEWLLFLDADVTPEPDLVERYFDPAPAGQTGVVAGGIVDDAVADAGIDTLAARYAALTRSLHQDNTFRERHAYAQTANCLVRRTAFTAVGGFEERIRSGGDADLCFRLDHAGWKLERREGAIVRHQGRDTLAALLRQRLRHGAGAGWLRARYPEFSRPLPATDLVRWTLAVPPKAVLALVRGDRDRALKEALDLLTQLAFEIGRHTSNAPRRRRPGLRRLWASTA